jgi:hypothetical protein
MDILGHIQTLMIAVVILFFLLMLAEIQRE